MEDIRLFKKGIKPIRILNQSGLYLKKQLWLTCLLFAFKASVVRNFLKHAVILVNENLAVDC